jgi:hypothetical protein
VEKCCRRAASARRSYFHSSAAYNVARPDTILAWYLLFLAPCADAGRDCIEWIGRISKPHRDRTGPRRSCAGTARASVPFFAMGRAFARVKTCALHVAYGSCVTSAVCTTVRIRRLQPFRYLHSCSGCFRLERLPGGALHPLESAAFPRRTPEADIVSTSESCRLLTIGSVRRDGESADGRFNPICLRGHPLRVQR